MLRTFTEKDFFSLLNKIAINKFEVPSNIDPFDLIKEVCRHLGNSNPVIRDELCYTLLAEWVYKKNILNKGQLRELYSIINSDNMWFYKIGENNPESIYMRSFSSLGITLLLLVDIDKKFLDNAEYINLLQRTVEYCELEKDLRGYNDENGWLHAAAHVADVLNACVKHPNFSKKHTEYILLAIYNIMENAQDVFQYEEDERLSRVIVTLFENKYLTLDELISWFKQANINLDTYILSMRKRINWKLLFRSCFSQLAKRKLFSYTFNITELKEVKDKFDAWYLKS